MGLKIALQLHSDRQNHVVHVVFVECFSWFKMLFHIFFVVLMVFAVCSRILKRATRSMAVNVLHTFCLRGFSQGSLLLSSLQSSQDLRHLTVIIWLLPSHTFSRGNGNETRLIKYTKVHWCNKYLQSLVESQVWDFVEDRMRWDHKFPGSAPRWRCRTHPEAKLFLATLNGRNSRCFVQKQHETKSERNYQVQWSRAEKRKTKKSLKISQNQPQ